MAAGVSPEAFNRLLSALDADPHRAGTAYKHLRERTAGLLRWWGAPDPEDLADLTLDRVARKLEEGVLIADGSFGAYVRGVARMIFYESRRRPQLQSGDRIHLAPPPSTDPDLLACLDSCLEGLPLQDRSVVLRYYGDGKLSDLRRRLGLEMGVSMTALRIRAYRLRAQLERCVLDCRSRA